MASMAIVTVMLMVFMLSEVSGVEGDEEERVWFMELSVADVVDSA